jgi:hypothetical protein
MFQFPSFASSPYFTQMMIMTISNHGVAPFGNVRVKACLAARRTLSWPTPSFVASMSLGIRLVPYLAYRIFFINGSFEPFINTYFYVRLLLLLFNPIQSSPNNLKRLCSTLLEHSISSCSYCCCNDHEIHSEPERSKTSSHNLPCPFRFYSKDTLYKF